jgi:hypothetical protein
MIYNKIRFELNLPAKTHCKPLLLGIVQAKERFAESNGRKFLSFSIREVFNCPKNFVFFIDLVKMNSIQVIQYHFGKS